MALEDRKLWAETHRDRPSLQQNGVTAPVRINHRGELMAHAMGKPAYSHAEAGNYYILRNPTGGSGVASIILADALDDLETFLFIRNDATAGDATRLYLDYLTIRVTVAGASGTTTNFFVKTDTGTSRYTSGGSTITPTNVNMASALAPTCTVKAGALITTAATSSARLLTSRQIRPVIAVATDVYEFEFGGPRRQLKTNVAVDGTAVCNQWFGCAPVVLGPADQFLFGLWGTSQGTAAQYEFELGLWEA